MQQLSRYKTIMYHLYPGIFITLGFIVLAPLSIQYGFPPQAGMLVAIALIALPLLLSHLVIAKKKESKKRITELNGLTNKLPAGKLLLFSLGLVALAFLIWGITQPLNQIITKNFLGWLPEWFTVQDLEGYSETNIKITLVLNLLLNGLLMPVIEELYFRGYLLPRMTIFGKYAFVINALLFSFYHFWQPYIYLTLILSLLPMNYVVWKKNDLRVAVLTHSLMNLTGAILSFGLTTNSNV